MTYSSAIATDSCWNQASQLEAAFLLLCENMKWLLIYEWGELCCLELDRFWCLNAAAAANVSINCSLKRQQWIEGFITLFTIDPSSSLMAIPEDFIPKGKQLAFSSSPSFLGNLKSAFKANSVSKTSKHAHVNPSSVLYGSSSSSEYQKLWGSKGVGGELISQIF